MTNKKNWLAVVCLILSGFASLKAQNGAVSSGGDASGSGGSVSYSIGQVDHITANGSGATITQGLQQPYEIYVITGFEAAGIELTASVYPNPASEQVTVYLKDLSSPDLGYILSDAKGKLIKQNKLSNAETVIPMAELSKASYFITVMNGKDVIKTFKIIKN